MDSWHPMLAQRRRRPQLLYDARRKLAIVALSVLVALSAIGLALIFGGAL